MRFEEKKELGKEVVELINEFESSVSEIREPFIHDIDLVENTEEVIIKFEHRLDGEVKLDISEAGKVYEEEIEGFGELASAFYESMEDIIESVADEYGQDSKEVKGKITELKVIENRCEKIQERLKEISTICA